MLKDNSLFMTDQIKYYILRINIRIEHGHDIGLEMNCKPDRPLFDDW